MGIKAVTNTEVGDENQLDVSLANPSSDAGQVEAQPTDVLLAKLLKQAKITNMYLAEALGAVFPDAEEN